MPASKKIAPAKKIATAAKSSRRKTAISDFAKSLPKPDLQPLDWIRAGMKILATSGIDMVLIPPLAKALGVTKGSFYWHFSSREELLHGLIEAWKQHATLRVIEIVESADVSPHEKIRLIAFIGTNSPIDEFGGAVELAVRNWARVNPDVRKVVADVDRQRLNYLTQLYQQVGSSVDPELLACLHYCFSAGLRLIFAYPEKQKLAMRQAALDQIFFSGHSM
ncbi:TetR/AcrR family transcriptional regulator [Limnohabitans sp. Rim11]|uniref:TetR/AcrR family transcriptional regulator n=1 Tax=Limnohabitans sp. Rim11 TaxID=1100719 RepID=UPI000AA77FF5|nr:TetR/AcrR family transcriptional regulator [Limnohabitans sp. Rim11]